jgi:hypothetical protein
MTRNLPAKERKSIAIPLYVDFTEDAKFEALKQINHDNAVLSHFPHIIYKCISVLYRRATSPIRSGVFDLYVGNSIRKLQIQVATYVFELSAGNCHR